MNSKKIVDYISANFVAAAGAIEQLQPGKYGTKVSKESEWFEPIAKKAMKDFGPPGFFKSFNSYQGMYVIDSQGRAYWYKVGLTYEEDDFIAMLKAAKEKWRESHRYLANNRNTIANSSASVPKAVNPSTSVVEVYSRILPLPKNASISERSIGRDFLWIYPDECRQILNSVVTIKKTVRMPTTLVARIVRYQLLLHVGNIMSPFDKSDVKQADFFMTRLPDEDGCNVFSFSGIYRSNAPARGSHLAQSLEGNISGKFSIDPTANKIRGFRAYGEANSQGGNDSLNERKVYPVVFAMTEARHAYAQEVVPFWCAVPLFAKEYRNPTIDIK